MNDDARLAAALQTGYVYNDKFHLDDTVRVTESNTHIDRCEFLYPRGFDRNFVSITHGLTGVHVTACTFGIEERDDLQTLYDLSDEATNGRRTEA